MSPRLPVPACWPPQCSGRLRLHRRDRTAIDAAQRPPACGPRPPLAEASVSATHGRTSAGGPRSASATGCAGRRGARQRALARRRRRRVRKDPRRPASPMRKPTLGAGAQVLGLQLPESLAVGPRRPLQRGRPADPGLRLESRHLGRLAFALGNRSATPAPPGGRAGCPPRRWPPTWSHLRRPGAGARLTLAAAESYHAPTALVAPTSSASAPAWTTPSHSTQNRSAAPATPTNGAARASRSMRFRRCARRARQNFRPDRAVRSCRRAWRRRTLAIRRRCQATCSHAAPTSSPRWRVGSCAPRHRRQQRPRSTDHQPGRDGGTGRRQPRRPVLQPVAAAERRAGPEPADLRGRSPAGAAARQRRRLRPRGGQLRPGLLDAIHQVADAVAGRARWTRRSPARTGQAAPVPRRHMRW